MDGYAFAIANTLVVIQRHHICGKYCLEIPSTCTFNTGDLSVCSKYRNQVSKKLKVIVL